MTGHIFGVYGRLVGSESASLFMRDGPSDDALPYTVDTHVY